MNKSLIYINVEDIHPHPDNPRKVLTDIEELAESIKAKGVMQNLTVVPREAGGYTAIIGHRRLAASKLAGLSEVPCVIVEMSYKDQLGTMLLENIQRSDLTVVEQAQGFQMMIDLGETVDTVAEKTGFSKSTVKRRIEIAKLDRTKLTAAAERKQLTIGDLDKLTQIDDVKARNKVLESMGTSNFEYALSSEIKKQKIAKALPYFKEAIKALGIKKLDNNDRYSSKYERLYQKSVRLNEWDPTTPIFSGKVPDGLLYFFDESWGDVEFYVKKKKAPPVKKTKAELEHEARIEEKWKELREIREAAYASRKAFVESFVMTSKNYESVIRGAALISYYAVTSYVRVSSTDIDVLLDVKNGLGYTERRAKIVDGVMNLPMKNLPTMIYMLFGDQNSLSYAGGHESVFPYKVDNHMLSLLYAWLELLGYELTEAEKQLRDGTHEIYKNEDEEK